VSGLGMSRLFGTEAWPSLRWISTIRGGTKHYSGTIGSIYDQGAQRNIADFHVMRLCRHGGTSYPELRRLSGGRMCELPHSG